MNPHPGKTVLLASALLVVSTFQILRAMTPALAPTFTDAEKQQQREAGEKIRDAILAAVARGEREFTVPPGHYRVSAPKKTDRYILTLDKTTNLTLNAAGATLVIEDFSGALQMRDCANITLRGLAIDYDPLPVVQAKIVEINSREKTILAEEEAGFELARLTPGLASRRLGALQSLAVHDAKTRRMKDDGAAFGIRSCEKNTDPSDTKKNGLLKIVLNTYDALTIEQCGVATGDLVSMRGSGATVVTSLDCRDMIFEDVTISGGPSMGIYERGTKTPTRYTRCHVARPANSPRLMSTGADAFHASMCERGPRYEECAVEGSGDDGYAVHGFLDFVMSQDDADARRVRVAPLLVTDFAQGSELTFFRFPSFEKIGSARVVSLTRTKDAALLKEARGLWKEASAVKGGRVIRMATEEIADIILDRPLALPRLSVVSSDILQSAGTKILRCTASNIRGRGILIQSADCLVEGNRVDWITGAGIEISADIPWMQGPFSHDVTVRGNVFENTFLGRGGRMAYKTALGTISVHIYTGALERGTPQKNIVITDNTIRRTYAAGIAVQNAENVTISGNRISDVICGDVVQLGGALGLDPRAALLFAEVKNLTLEANTIARPLPAGVSEIAINKPRQK
ncbi:MAG: right-handed parallel beta-helix repeat-containing protein [Opitutaceae bacterium]|jgi:parallel beta-helix repeat protein|nr:right-handed parallel beta-helix repeat-containing protein [Opitutaceae bacterium]